MADGQRASNRVDTSGWGSVGVKSCGHGSGLGVSAGQIMLTREWLGGGSNHVDTGVAGGQRGSREWLGVSGGQIIAGANHVDTGVAGGQRGSDHVDT